MPLGEVVGRGEEVENSLSPLPLLPLGEREGDIEEHPVGVRLAISRGEDV